MKWMKPTVVALACAILLLITGGSPVLGVPQIYHSGAFLLIGLIIGLLAILGIWFCRRKPALLLLHLGAVLIMIGSYIDFALEKKVSFGIFVGDEYVSKILYDEKTQVEIPLDFSFVIRSFDVQYYPQTFSLYEKKDEKEPERVEEGINKEDRVDFKKHDISMPFSELKDENGEYLPYRLVDAKQIIAKDRLTEKFYKADFRIIDDGEQKDLILAINHPITYDSWRFYLMSHGVNQGRQYVYLQARNAPGRYCSLGGMYVLIVGSFLFTFLRKKKKGASAA